MPSPSKLGADAELTTPADPPDVLRCAAVGFPTLATLLARFGLELVACPEGAELPGSYWGEAEAGLIGHRVYVRADTPIHSLLHEACHTICVDPERRANLHTEAGGDDLEENAVCYLQILLADHIAPFGRDRAWLDMDRWGYSFRLGSARAWFENDASDARVWLIDQGLIDTDGTVLFRLRGSARATSP